MPEIRGLIRHYSGRFTLRVALFVILTFALVGVGLQAHQRAAQAAVLDIAVLSVTPDCTQATIRITDDGTGDGQVRQGHIDFAGAVTIPTINVSCAASEPNAPQCNGQGPEDDFTVPLNGGAGYSSASPVTINYTATNDTAWGIFNTGAGFSLNGTIQLPACGAGGGTGGGTAQAALPPLDPPGTAPRVWGGYDHPASPLVVYNQPYGYQFYHNTGEPLGLVDMNAVGIPGPRGLITSMSSGIWRVDLYYLHDDRVQANLYENGVLIEEAFFDVAGIGARAGEVPSQTAPPFGGGGTAVVQQPTGGSVQLVCRQNLRQGASTETAVLSVMEVGTVLTIHGRSNDATWLHVASGDGLNGWVFNGRCVNAGPQQFSPAPIEVVFEGRPDVNGGAATAQQPPPPIVAAADGSPIIGIACRQNLRSGPGMEFTSLRVLPSGATLNVVGRSNDGTWLQVTATGASGWVYFGQCVVPQLGDVTAAPVTVAFGG